MNLNLDYYYDQLHSILQNYTTYIVDLWGVIHDDQGCLPLADTIIRVVNDLGGQLIFITNSPERSALIGTRLQQLHCDLPISAEVISAGEVLHKDLQTKEEFLGKSFFIIDYDDNKAFFSGLSVSLVDNVAQADFILVRSIHPDVMLLNQYASFLKEGIHKNIPLIIVNCDMVVALSNGIAARPGLLIPFYQQQKGKIILYGKPYPQIYKLAMQGKQPQKNQRVLCIGDSIYTDILGANLSGFDSLLLQRNDHPTEISNDHTITVGLPAKDLAKLPSLIKPKYILQY